MGYNLIEDISQISTINEIYLSKLIDMSVWDISNCTEESILKNTPLTEINIGIGTLLILIEDNNIKYKFIPSKKLDKAIKDTVLDRKNPLILKLEKSLIEKISNIYKDLI